jgi:hypothetical protein
MVAEDLVQECCVRTWILLTVLELRLREWAETYLLAQLVVCMGRGASISQAASLSLQITPFDHFISLWGSSENGMGTYPLPSRVVNVSVGIE